MKLNDFLNVDESCQADFLIRLARVSWEKIDDEFDVRDAVFKYLDVAEEVLDGRIELIPDLLRFMGYKSDGDDFFDLGERVERSESHLAAVNLSSYACGFACRVAALKAGYRSLPDSVLEAVPELFVESCRESAELLGIEEV